MKRIMLSDIGEGLKVLQVAERVEADPNNYTKFEKSAGKELANALQKKPLKQYTNPETGETFYGKNVYDSTPQQRLTSKVLRSRAANRKKRKARKRRK